MLLCMKIIKNIGNITTVDSFNIDRGCRFHQSLSFLSPSLCLSLSLSLSHTLSLSLSLSISLSPSFFVFLLPSKDLSVFWYAKNDAPE